MLKHNLITMTKAKPEIYAVSPFKTLAKFVAATDERLLERSRVYHNHQPQPPLLKTGVLF